MRTLSQIQQDDNSIIWIIRFNFDFGKSYLSTRDIKLTQYYNSNVISTEQIGEVISDSEINYFKGSVAISSKFELKINLKNENSLFNRGLNSYAPDPRGHNLLNRTIDLGLVYSGSSSDNQIIWLNNFTIVDYKSPNNQLMILSLFDNFDFAETILPKWKVQNQFDNLIDYNVTPDETIKNSVLPTIYGNFDKTNFSSLYAIKKLSKGLLWDSFLSKYKFSWHKLNPQAIIPALYKWVQGALNFMIISPTSPEIIDSNSGYLFTLKSAPNQYYESPSLIGSLYVLNFMLGKFYNINNLDLAPLLNENENDFVTIRPGEFISLKMASSITQDEVGYLGFLPDDIKIRVRYFPDVRTHDTGVRKLKLKIYNEANQSYYVLETIDESINWTVHSDAYLDFAQDVRGKSDGILPYKPEELSSLNFYIENVSEEQDQNIDLIFIRLELKNIVVYNFRPPFSGKIRVGREDGY